jgi:hypothetical protein
LRNIATSYARQLLRRFRSIALLPAALALSVAPADAHGQRHHSDKHRYRRIDGSGNHSFDHLMGAAGSPLPRWVGSDYTDGTDTMAGGDRPSARAISNAATFQWILVRQFRALRDADRHWYQRGFSRTQVRELERTRLSDIIRRNTRIRSELQPNVFYVGK